MKTVAVISPLAILSKLESASADIVITKDEAKALVGQVNFLENVVSVLLSSIRKRKKLIDVEIPTRKTV